MSAVTIYKTVLTVTILSPEPYIDGYDFNLSRIADDITYGECSGSHCVTEYSTPLTGKEAVDAVLEQGSEPSFFLMDEDGNELGGEAEEEEEEAEEEEEP